MTSQRVRDRLVERLRDGSANGAGIADENVLNAIRTVPRHLFVDEALASRAYEDTAADRSRADHFPALGGGADDRGAAAVAAAQGAGDRHRLGPGRGAGRARAGGLHGRAHRRAAAPGAQALPFAGHERAHAA
jgi:hypothetical protein